MLGKKSLLFLSHLNHMKIFVVRSLTTVRYAKKKAMFYELSHMTKHNKQQEESIPFTIVMNAGC